MKTCFNCGGDKMENKKGTYRFEMPPHISNRPLCITNTEWIECANCGDTMIPPSLSDRIEEACIIRQGLLLPKYIKEIREKNKLKESEMATLLNITKEQYLRYENGRSIQSKEIDNNIRKISL